MLGSLTDVQFIPCNCKGPTTTWRPSQGARMWRPFSSTTTTRTRSLSLFSLQSSSTSPFIVRSLFSYSSTYTSNTHRLKVQVWWDFNTCELPTGVSVSEVAPIITAALEANGINGPIQMNAFGDIDNLSIENREAILSSGIDFEHIPKEPEDSVFRTILRDVNCWADEKILPRNLFFISGYDNLACYLRSWRDENYNVLVASTGPDMDELCSASNIAWDWNLLIRGKKLIGHRTLMTRNESKRNEVN